MQLYVALLCLCVGLASCQMTIYSPEDVKGSWDAYSYKFMGEQPYYELYSRVVLADPSDGCSPLKNAANVSGLIVAVSQLSCSTPTKARNAQDAGAMAMIVINDARYVRSGCYIQPNSGDITIPVLDITPPEGDSSGKNLGPWMADHPDTPLDVKIIPQRDYYDRPVTWGLYTAFFEVLGAICIGLASQRLYLFVKAKRFALNLPCTVLVLEIITNIVRNIILPLTPTGICRPIFTFEASSVLFTISFPLAFIADLLIAIHWHALATQKKLTKSPLKNLPWYVKVLFVAFCVFLVVVDLAADILRAQRSESALGLVIISAVFFIVSLFIVAVYFLYSGIKMISFMRNQLALTRHEDGNTITKRLTRLVIITGTCLLICMIFIILEIFPTAGDDFWIFTIWMMFGSYGIASLCQILIFIPPELERNSSAITPATQQSDISSSL